MRRLLGSFAAPKVFVLTTVLGFAFSGSASAAFLQLGTTNGGQTNPTVVSGNVTNGLFRFVNTSSAPTGYAFYAAGNALNAAAFKATNPAGTAVLGSGRVGVSGASSSGTGVRATSNTNNAVWATSGGSGASGVYGENTGGGYGIAGRTGGPAPGAFGDNTGSGPGVFGQSLGGWGGEFTSIHSIGATQVDGRIVASGRIQSPQWNVAPVTLCDANGANCGTTKNGPLPIKGDFASHGGLLMVFVSGTAFATDPGAVQPPIICLAISIDSGAAQFSCIYGNEVEHLSIPSYPMIFTGLGSGTHTLHIDYGSTAPQVMNTNIDDTFHAVVQELPF